MLSAWSAGVPSARWENSIPHTNGASQRRADRMSANQADGNVRAQAC